MPEGADPEKRRWTRILTTVGALIGVTAGAIGLAFTIAPELKPCLGDNSAAFTGAPVFPHVHIRDSLIRNGIPKEEVAKEQDRLGAEVRFSYRTSGFRGDELTVTWSLLTIEHDGTLGAVVAGQDRALATTVTPETCSEVGGKDLFVQTPPDARVRYLVVLELYRNRRLQDRLALTETDPFRG